MLLILPVVMLAYHGYYFARHRRPFRILHLSFWGIMLANHWAQRAEVYAAAGVILVVAFFMQRRDVPDAIRGLQRELDEARRRNVPR